MLTPMCGRVRLSSDVSEIKLAGPEYARPRHHRPRGVKDDLLFANIDTRHSAQIVVLFTANMTEKRQGVKRLRRPIAQFEARDRRKKVKQISWL
jgi:hypothetical protein